MQSDASQCMWSKEDSLCSIANPPSDPVFTILVALLTMIMSIPVLMFLQYILEEYASKTPGCKPVSHADAILITKNSPGKNSLTVLNIAEGTSAHHTASQSDFAKVIKLSVGVGNGKKIASKAEVAHFAYAGELLRYFRGLMTVFYCVQYDAMPCLAMPCNSIQSNPV